MKLTQSPTFITQRLRRIHLSAPLRIATIALLIGASIGSYHLYHDLRPTPYVASKDDFRIVFKGTPTINTIPSKSDGSGGQESGRIYDYVNSSNKSEYAIYVLTYTKSNASSLSATATKAALLSDITQLGDTDKDTISNGKVVSLNGLVAIQATLTPTDSSEPTLLVAFLRKSDLYILFGHGISQSSFESFVHTFHFTN
jgi:hypothetical protein